VASQCCKGWTPLSSASPGTGFTGLDEDAFILACCCSDAGGGSPSLSQCCHTWSFRACVTLGPCHPAVQSAEGREGKRVKQCRALPCRSLIPGGLGRWEERERVNTVLLGGTSVPSRGDAAAALPARLPWFQTACRMREALSGELSTENWFVLQPRCAPGRRSAAMPRSGFARLAAAMSP